MNDTESFWVRVLCILYDIQMYSVATTESADIKFHAHIFNGQFIT